ncbi:hypothetical protein JCM8547_002056 [Rhodosporidiobolus lusitaniae]
MVLPLFAGRKDTLSVQFLEDVVFLTPPPHLPSPADSNSSEPPSTQDDPLLRGQVTLVCLQPRRAKRIKVDLVGLAARHGGDGSYSHEQSVVLEKSLSIDLIGERLERGTHTWDFSFIVPSSAAVSERSVYGTVRYTVRATLHAAGNFRDLASMPKPVWLIANPAAPGELPSGLEIDVRHTASELGPIALHISSPHLTVASLLFLGVTFESPPVGMKIMSVQAFVRQEFEIHYSQNDVPVQHPPVQRKLLFYADSTTPVPTSSEDLLDRPNLSRGAPPPLSYEPRALLPKPLARLEQKEWTYARVTRIPDDDLVRPSTLEGTDTPIRVKHNLVCQVRYRMKGSNKDQVLEMSSAVTIASCCCLTSSLLLPEYRSRHHPSSCASQQRSSSAAPASRSRSGSQSAADALSAAHGGVPIGFDSPAGTLLPFHRRCLCNTPLQQLVAADGEKLAGAAESRSRSRTTTPGPSSSSRSRSRRRPGAARSGDEDIDSGFEDDSAGEDSRGRDVRRRKVGETYDVPPEPVENWGIEEIPPAPGSGMAGMEDGYFSVRPARSRARGVSWAAQGEALRPASRVRGVAGEGQTYLIV